MSIDLDSVDFNKLQGILKVNSEEDLNSHTDERIHLLKNEIPQSFTDNRRFTRSASYGKSECHKAQKLSQVFKEKDTPSHFKSMDAGGSVGGKIEVGWGGKDGPTFSVSAQGEVHDNSGNKIAVSVSQNSDGTGTASVSGNAGVSGNTNSGNGK